VPARPTARQLAETEKFRAEARYNDALSDFVDIELLNAQEERAELLASDDRARVYRYVDDIEEYSVQDCMETLAIWARVDEDTDRKKSPFEIIFTCWGGSVLHGFGLYDYLRLTSRQGHPIITTDIGISASMAGVLLQAGDVRQIGRESHFHMHDMQLMISKWTSLPDVIDHMEWSKRMEDRTVQIFLDKAEGKITKKQLVDLYRRKEVYLSSEEALKYGLVDVIL
jgi:ATP-dependent protease ClpP protease subunit